MTIPTMGELREILRTVPRDKGYDGNGDPRIVEMLDQLIKEDFAEPFWSPVTKMNMVRWRDPNEVMNDLMVVDQYMRKHRWTKVVRTMGKTTATREDE
jgi:hypothetical protein